VTATPRAAAGELAAPVRLSPADLLLLGLTRLRSRPLRVVLAALGISIGVATLVVVTGIPASGQQALMDQFATLGTNLLRAEAAPATEAGAGASLPPESVAMATRIGPVEQVGAVANTHAVVRRSDHIPDEESSGLAVLAGSANLVEILGGQLHSGSYLTPVTSRFPTVVLGSVAATRLGITELSPGRPPPQLRINDRWFTVVGVLAPMPLAPDVERLVVVGWAAAHAELGFDERPTVLYLRAAEPAIGDVRAVLPATLDPEHPGQVQVSRPSDALIAKRITQNTFSALFLGLASVALLVGGIGVANTMVISVLERRREIGLSRALGANRGHIRAQFLTESVVLCAVGGIAGILLGLLGTTVYATIHHWPTVVPLGTLLGGLAASASTGILAGVYPAMRASRLTPTEALAAP
jgi:putative ABC transport system permease protein